MNNWNVLIIDDEAQYSEDNNSRYNKYMRLQGQHYDPRGFHLTFADSPGQAKVYLETETPEGKTDIVLLDVRLNKKGWDDDEHGTLFKDLFRRASERYVVALVSNAWDDSSMKLVRGFLSDNPDIDQPLMFTLKDFQSGGFAAICTQIVLFLRRKKSLYSLDIRTGDDLQILHLSDLHFGSQGTEKTLASIPDINFLCDKIMAEWTTGPHFVAITGDIANTGHPKEYAMALGWFQSFMQKLGISLPSPRILLVPGNHDVSIPLAGAQQLKLNFQTTRDDKPNLEFVSSVENEATELNTYASQPFSNFAAKVSSTKGVWGNAPVGSWTEFGFYEYGVVFSGLNTSKKINEKSWPLRTIDKHDIDCVIESFKEKGFSNNNNAILHISLSHHSPVGYGGVREQIDDHNDFYLNRFMQQIFAPRLLIHGHNHKRWGTIQDGNKYMVVGAPSPSGNNQKQDAARGVNMISMKRDNSRVKKICASSIVYSESGWMYVELPNIHKFELS
jgi:predicted MPP superfamily phosphohydrolase